MSKWLWCQPVKMQCVLVVSPKLRRFRRGSSICSVWSRVLHADSDGFRLGRETHADQSGEGRTTSRHNPSRDSLADLDGHNRFVRADFPGLLPLVPCGIAVLDLARGNADLRPGQVKLRPIPVSCCGGQRRFHIDLEACLEVWHDIDRLLAEDVCRDSELVRLHGHPIYSVVQLENGDFLEITPETTIDLANRLPHRSPFVMS